MLAKKFGLDGFILALLGMISLAWLIPGPGAVQGVFSLDTLASIGITVIFLFYGIGLAPEKLKSGLKHWRLHLLVQCATFAMFPVLAYFGSLPWMNDANQLIWFGVFYLAALPSTVSSSVVMVSIARGNVPAAIFNASISGMIGVFLTPLWMSFFMNTRIAGANVEVWFVIVKLTLIVIFPVGLGMLLNKRFGDTVTRNRNRLKMFDQSVILLVVYTSFCESFASGVFKEIRFWDLVMLTSGLFVMFWIVFGAVNLIAFLLGFKREDRITAGFCGSKKSLVHGTAMSKALFPGITGIGIILLPLMLYHAMQLIIISVIAQKQSKHDT